MQNVWRLFYSEFVGMDMVSYCFLVLLRFCAFMHVVTLPASRFVSNGTRLRMDAYSL